MAGLHMQTPANIFMTARRHVTVRGDLLHQIGALFASNTIDLFLVVISSCQDTTPQGTRLALAPHISMPSTALRLKMTTQSDQTVSQPRRFPSSMLRSLTLPRPSLVRGT